MASQLDSILREVNKKHNEDVFIKGLPEYNYERIPFTSPRMNYCTYGGIPTGRITEFYGEEHGGKTTSALDIVKNFQQMYPDREVLYVDSENTLDTRWARTLGVDTDRLYILQPKSSDSDSAEFVFNTMLKTIGTGEVGLWVLDSIPALIPKQELEKDIEDVQVAGVSKPLTKFARKVTGLMSKYECTGISINQERDVIGAMFPTKNTPGGHAWKHFCSVRIDFSHGKFIDENGKEVPKRTPNPLGNIVEVSMVKNKTCPPSRKSGSYTLTYRNGIDYFKDLIETAIFFEIIEKKGAWYTVVDTNSGEILKDKIQGETTMKKLLQEDDQLLALVETLVEEKITDMNI